MVVSDDTKKKIMSAVDHTTDLVDDGLHPTDAVLKAAQVMDLSPGAGEIVAKAFNIGRTTVQREDSDDVTHKVAEFELADPEYVRDHLNKKEAAAARAADVVDDVYSAVPADLLNHYHAQKVAAMPVLPVVELTPMEQCTDKAFLHTAAEIQRTQRKLARAYEDIDTATRALNARLDKLAATLTRIDAPAISRLVKIAELKGEQGVVAICNELGSRCTLLGKRADNNPNSVLSEFEQDCYKEIKACADDTATLCTLQNQYTKLAEESTDTLVKTASEFVDYADEPFGDLVLEDQEMRRKIARMPLGTVGNAVGAAIGAAMGGRYGSPANAQNFEDINYYISALANPQHDRKLQTIKARTVLEGLMHMDPVLKSYHPDDVVEAYNAIVGMAPRAGDHAPYLQSMMRKYLAQGKTLAPDDIATNVYGANKAILQGQGDMKDEAVSVQKRPSAGVGAIGRAASGISGLFD